MGLTAGQRRALRKIGRGIQVSDPRLASMLDMFGQIEHHRFPLGVDTDPSGADDDRQPPQREIGHE
jgi:hypothetical protein